MNTLVTLLIIIGFSVLVIGLILLIVNAIKKRSLKKYGITILIGVILMVIAVIIVPEQIEKPIEKPKIEEPKIEKPIEKPKIEEPKIEEPIVEEPVVEEVSLVEDTALFKLYSRIANRDTAHGKIVISNYLEAQDFDVEEDSSVNSFKVTDKNSDDDFIGDYVYIVFDEFREGNIIMSASYYSKSKNAEVSFSNYATDGDRKYDKLQTHIIGESNVDVKTSDEQIKFLKNR